MNAFGGMFAGYQDPYRMGLADPTGMGMHAHHAHHMHHAHHGYKVPRIYFKIPRVLPYKEQKEKFETDDYFKKLARESEVWHMHIIWMNLIKKCFKNQIPIISGFSKQFEFLISSAALCAILNQKVRLLGISGSGQKL